MAKLTLSDILSGYLAQTTINNNNALIEAALENTLSRDGTSPNAMGATLDMNSNRIINLPSPSSPNDAARLADVTSLVSLTNVALPSQTGNAGKALVTDGFNISWGSTTPANMAVTNADNNFTANQQFQAITVKNGFDISLTGPSGGRLYYNDGATGSNTDHWASGSGISGGTKNYFRHNLNNHATGGSYWRIQFGGLEVFSIGTITGGNSAADIVSNGVARIRRKPTDTSRTSTTTNTADPHLTFNVVAGTYIAEVFLIILGVTTGTQGFKFALDGTAPVDGSYSNYGLIDGVANNAPINAPAQPISNSMVGGGLSLANIAIAGRDIVRFQGSITFTSSGTYQVQWAQNSSSANATKLCAGSYFSLTPVPAT